jgi:hypothetical protein
MGLASEIVSEWTPNDFEVLLQMIGYKISSFTVFSLVHILSTCLGGSS